MKTTTLMMMMMMMMMMMVMMMMMMMMNCTLIYMICNYSERSASYPIQCIVLYGK